MFDFGGVISSSPFEAFAHLEAEHGLPTDFIRTVNATSPDTNAWAKLERGEVDVETFGSLWSVEARALGRDLDGRLVLERLGGEIRPQMVAAIRACGTVYKTACLTNNFVRAEAVLSVEVADVYALFDAVLATQKDGPLFVTAILRKGNALYALGGADPTKYELAASNYGLLLSSNQGDFAQRNEAAYMRAMCFEKLGRTDDALALYLDVLNGRTLPPEAGNAPLPPEFHWRVLAGNSAAEIRKQQQDWPGAIDVYRRLESLGGPQQNEFHDDIIRLRREHFLFDDAEVPTATVAPVAPANAPVPTPAPATAPAAAPAPSLAPAPAKAGP